MRHIYRYGCPCLSVAVLVPNRGLFIIQEAILRKIPLAAVGVVSALALTAVPGPSVAVDEINTREIREAVTIGGILGHDRALQWIANRNDGTRASGTPGYAASADYVKRTLTRAGYDVTEQEFAFDFFRELAPASLSQVSPTPTDYETSTLGYSGSGEVTGKLVPTNDIMVPPPATPSSTNSGCAPTDFPTAPPGDAIALIQRGTCFFEDKAANAEAAGYEAVVIFNEGQPGRTELLTGTLGRPFALPVVGISHADGAALYEQTKRGDVVMNVVTSTESEERTTSNILADSPDGKAEKSTVVGAHLDSVIEGPGINDNGSGTSAILEIAEEMAELGKQPRQRIRFAFWGAEESGLLGSTHYVESLDDQEFGQIVANLNFDMVGSTNYVRFVYDGDGSDSDPEGPPGSAQIEDIFTEYFAGQGLESAPTEFSGRSDYGPFIEAGIPAGGLFTGAEGVKTAEEAAIYGGTAGEAYDSCYRQACDNINNLSTKALGEMSDAAAHAVWTLARTKTGFFEDGSLRTTRYKAPKFKYSGSHAQR